FFVLSGNFVKQRHECKSESPKRCKRSAKQFLPPLSLEIRRVPIDRQTGIHSKSFKQDLSRASRSTKPRRRRRVVKHAVQIIVLLRIEATGSSIPMFGQLVDLSVEKKIDSGLIPKPVGRLPIQKFDSAFKK